MTPIATPALIAHNIPWAGLGNRIRFTFSAQLIAQRLARAFYYSWPTGSRFGAALTDLWQYDAATVGAKEYPATLTEQDDLSASDPVLSVRSSSALRHNGQEVPWGDVLASLPPVPDIAERVGTFRAEHLPGRYIGVQIRASEKTHARTLEASPASWFTTRMRQVLDSDPDARFFVSCDEPAVQDRILAEFPAVGLDDKGAYNSAEAVRASVVDLYLLAGATHLLGPYWSTFVELAWILSGRAELENSRRTRPAYTAAPLSTYTQ